MYYIGAHIKKESGKLLNTIEKIHYANGNALQLFVSNPRSSQSPNLDSYNLMKDEVKEFCLKHSFKLIIHASYTINLAKEPKLGKKTLELKDCYWIDVLLNQLIVSDLLGALGVVVHVGKYTTNTKEYGLKHMRNAILYVIEQMQSLKLQSKLIIETPAGAGTELLNTVEEFTEFYNQFNTIQKQYLGICLDTAHVWSSGYDIIEYYNYLIKINKKDIVAIHLNNSKKEKGSNVDLHETLFGKEGKIDTQILHNFLTNLKQQPMIILETPSDTLEKDIKWVKNCI
jgi:deoxyribonuclease-4